MEKIQTYLGHADLKNTLIYTKTAGLKDEDHANMMAAMGTFELSVATTRPTNKREAKAEAKAEARP